MVKVKKKTFSDGTQKRNKIFNYPIKRGKILNPFPGLNNNNYLKYKIGTKPSNLFVLFQVDVCLLFPSSCFVYLFIIDDKNATVIINRMFYGNRSIIKMKYNRTLILFICILYFCIHISNLSIKPI